MVDTPDPGAPAPAPLPASKSEIGSRLDAMLVIGALVLVGGVLGGLFFARVPQANLPIIASLAGFLAGSILGGYAAYRWGASDAMKKASSSGSAQ